MDQIVSFIFNLEVNFQVKVWWELRVKIFFSSQQQKPKLNINWNFVYKKLLTHVIESPGPNKYRTQMSLYQDLVPSCVLCLGWPHSCVISPLLWHNSPGASYFAWCSVTTSFNIKCWGWGGSLIEATNIKQQSLNKSLWSKRWNLLTGKDVDHGPSSFELDR